MRTAGGAAATLRRRRLGALVVIVGLVVVVAGLFADITGQPQANVGGSTVTLGGGAAKGGVDAQHSVTFSTGSGTAADQLRHVLDHGVVGDTNVQKTGDVFYRAGIVLIPVAALLAFVLLLGPSKGLIGIAAGVGLLGLAFVIGVTAGRSTRLSDYTNGAFHVNIGAGAWVILVGLLLMLAGGAMAAFRPLAGLIPGVTLAAVGAAIGIALGFAIAGDHLARGASLLHAAGLTPLGG